MARNFSFDRIEHGRNRRGDMQRRGKTKQSRRIWLGSYYFAGVTIWLLFIPTIAMAEYDVKSALQAHDSADLR